MSHAPLRIATLVPAATDLVAALGLADAIVARSHECDHPLVADRPVVTSSNVPAAGVGGDTDPAEVDAAVSATLAEGGPLYTVDTDRLAELEVDVVVSQTICDVCAVRRDQFDGELAEHVRVVDVTAVDLDGLRRDITELAAALGVPERADALIGSVDARVQTVRQRAAGRRRPAVATIEWTDPPFVGGHWVPEMVELAGGRHLLTSPGEASRRCGWDDLLGTTGGDAAEIVLVLPCGYDLAGTVREAERLVAGPLAGSDAAVWALDANALTSRCTAAYATAVETIAAIVAGEKPAPGTAVCVREAAGATS